MAEFSEILRTEFPGVVRSTVYKLLKDLCNDGRIFRIGKGSYAVNNAKSSYIYDLSDTAKGLSNAIIDDFPLIDFQIRELYQMNEFVNLLFARKTIFIDVEKYVTHSRDFRKQNLFPFTSASSRYCEA